MIDADAAERLAATAARLLPPSLAPSFDARFIRSDRLFDAYVTRLTLDVLRAVPAELDARLAAVPLAWMKRRLAEHGPPDMDAAELRAEQERHDPAGLPSYALAEAAARDYPTFLAGTRSGEDLLLGPKQLALWRSYFSNDHVLYAVNNRVGAVALERWLRPGANTILELGAGMGSGTAAALAQVAGAGRLGDVGSYRVTELVPTFLRFAQRHVDERFAGLPGLTFGALDMNQPFAPQGVAPRSVSVVYAVNTLHVARDLAATLGEIHAALEPGGQLVFAECVRPADGQTLYPEFVFNMLATFRARGFLTPGQWTKALDAAGFVDVRIFPDVARIHEAVPGFCLGAIGATRP